MTGTVLATISTIILAILAVGGALLVAERSRERQEAKPTRKRREADYVTREEMDEAIEKVAKALEWEWTEMYEKFEKLHLRLAKRDQRKKQQEQQEQQDAEEGQGVIPLNDRAAAAARRSALPYRRFGSV